MVLPFGRVVKQLIVSVSDWHVNTQFACTRPWPTTHVSVPMRLLPRHAFDDMNLKQQLGDY